MPKILQGKNVGNDDFFASIIPNYVESLNSLCDSFKDSMDLKFDFASGKNVELKLSTGEVIFRLQRMKYEGTGKEICALSPKLTNASYRKNNENDYYEIITTAYYFALGKLSLDSDEDMVVLCKLIKELVKLINNNQRYDYKLLLTLCGYSVHESVNDTDEISFKCQEMSESDQKALISNNSNGEILGTVPSDERRYKKIIDEAAISMKKEQGPKKIRIISAGDKKWYKDFIGMEINVLHCHCRNREYTYRVSNEEFKRILENPIYKKCEYEIQGLALAHDDVEIVSR
ncbi:MAG: hypothetical protein RR636_04645 [Clostridium sp.]|uniref:hypothetical protein n=1 Tax=Clostridium sp. TaxID=1506 RepID=UPI003029425E